MVKPAPYNDLKVRRLPSYIYILNNLKSSLEPTALALNSSVYFDTIVADIELLVQVPKLSMAAWTLNLLLLFSSTCNKILLLSDCCYLYNFQWIWNAFWIFSGVLVICCTVEWLIAFASGQDWRQRVGGVLLRNFKSKNDIINYVVWDNVRLLAVRIILLLFSCGRMLLRRFRIPFFVLIYWYRCRCSSVDFTAAHNTGLSWIALKLRRCLGKGWNAVELVGILVVVGYVGASEGESSESLSVNHFYWVFAGEEIFVL